MNDRIGEMWRECVLKHTSASMNWQNVADEFAELIVRECATLAYDGPGGILEHFGVKDE